MNPPRPNRLARKLVGIYEAGCLLPLAYEFSEESLRPRWCGRSQSQLDAQHHLNSHQLQGQTQQIKVRALRGRRKVKACPFPWPQRCPQTRVPFSKMRLKTGRFPCGVRIEVGNQSAGFVVFESGFPSFQICALLCVLSALNLLSSPDNQRWKMPSDANQNWACIYFSLFWGETNNYCTKWSGQFSASEFSLPEGPFSVTNVRIILQVFARNSHASARCMQIILRKWQLNWSPCRAQQLVVQPLTGFLLKLTRGGK